MDEIPFQIPATMQDVRLTRHRSAIIKLETQEEMPDAMLSRLSSLVGKDGWFTHSVEQITPEDLVDLPRVPKLDGKTPAQRLRAVLFVAATQAGTPKEKFEDYYVRQMEYFIEMVKAGLEPEV